MIYAPQGGGVDYGRSRWPSEPIFGHSPKAKTPGDWYKQNAWMWNPGTMARNANKVTETDIRRVLSAISSARMGRRQGDPPIDAGKVLAALFGRPARTVPKVKGGGVSFKGGRGGRRGGKKKSKAKQPQYHGIKNGKVSHDPPKLWSEAQGPKAPRKTAGRLSAKELAAQASKRWGVPERVAAETIKRRTDPVTGGMPTQKMKPTNRFGWGAGRIKAPPGGGLFGANTWVGGLATWAGSQSALGSVMLRNLKGRAATRTTAAKDFDAVMGNRDVFAMNARTKAMRAKIGGFKTKSAYIASQRGLEEENLENLMGANRRGREAYDTAEAEVGGSMSVRPMTDADKEKQAKDREKNFW